jgi:hypothetical protein
VQVVPLQSVPNQIVNVGLGTNQQCTISIYQRTTGLFFDLSVAGAVIITGVLCLDQNLLVRNTYLGFVGDLAFFDTQGTNDPDYTGLDGRYQLVYLAPGDITGLPPGVGGSTIFVTSPVSGGGGVAPPPSLPSPSPVGISVLSSGQFTLNPNATTTFVGTLCTSTSVVLYEPITPHAANDMATTSCVAGNGLFTLTHANNSRTDRTFSYVVLG